MAPRKSDGHRSGLWQGDRSGRTRPLRLPDTDTSNLPTKIIPTTVIPTKIAWLKLSGKLPTGMRIPPLQTKTTISFQNFMFVFAAWTLAI